MASGNTLIPKDVDKEVFLLFSVLDESKSRYLNVNLQNIVNTLDGANGHALNINDLSSSAKAKAFNRLSKHPLVQKVR